MTVMIGLTVLLAYGALLARMLEGTEKVVDIRQDRGPSTLPDAIRVPIGDTISQSGREFPNEWRS